VSAAADVITAGLVQILVTLSNELLPNFQGCFCLSVSALRWETTTTEITSSVQKVGS
jgi:hypothetical protein